MYTYIIVASAVSRGPSAPAAPPRLGFTLNLHVCTTQVHFPPMGTIWAKKVQFRSQRIIVRYKYTNTPTRSRSDCAVKVLRRSRIQGS